MSLAIDGAVHMGQNPAGAGTVFTVGPLTTSNSNDIICVAISSSGAPVLTVLASSGLAFTRRAATAIVGGGNQAIEFWYAVAAAPLVAATITVTLSSQPGFITMDAFGVSGADLTNIFDRNGSLPAKSQNDPIVLSASTLNGQIMVLGFFHETTTVNPLAGPGFTLISGADHQLSEYTLTVGPQVNLSIDDNTPGDADGIVADVIVGGFGAVSLASHGTGVHFSDDVSVVAY